MKTRISESSVWPKNDYAKKQLVQQKALRKHMNAFEVSACDVDNDRWKTRIERIPIVSTGPELFQLNRKINTFKISSSKHPCRCWSRPCVLCVISEHSSVRWTNMMWIKSPTKRDSLVILIYLELFQAREVFHKVVQDICLNMSETLFHFRFYRRFSLSLCFQYDSVQERMQFHKREVQHLSSVLCCIG